MTECKTCRKCKQSKTLAEFHKDKNKRLGVSSSCKPCNLIYWKAYYKANREHIAAYNKAYYEANRERIKANRRALYEAKREGDSQ